MVSKAERSSRFWFRCLPSLWRAWTEQKAGVTAVEFALISPLFFGALFAMMETGTLFLRINAMDAGVDAAKRAAMIGQVAASSSPMEELRANFCAQAGWVIDCSQVYFDVRSFTDFTANSMPSAIVNGEFTPGAMQFSPGGPCQIVIIRAYYETSALTSLVRRDVSNLNNGNILLTGSAAFKNEPFGTC